MFYRVTQKLCLVDHDTGKQQWSADLYEEEGVSTYYRTVLQAQQAADRDNEKEWTEKELRVDTCAVIKRISKEEYVKYLINISNTSNNTLIYLPRRSTYWQMCNRSFLYNLILSWKEYLEEVYV